MQTKSKLAANRRFALGVAVILFGFIPSYGCGSSEDAISRESQAISIGDSGTGDGGANDGGANDGGSSYPIKRRLDGNRPFNHPA
jgi:hypothetical protein